MAICLWREIRAMIPVYLASYCSGIHYSWTSANIKSLRSEPLSYSDDDISLITSFLHFGRLMGPLAIIFLTGRYGRKNHVIAGALLLLISHIMLTTWKSVQILLLIRFIIGFQIGLLDNISLMYVGEVLSKQFRGMLGTCWYICFTIGTTTAYLQGICFDYDDTSLILLALSIAFLLSALCAVETPYFLLMQGDTANAAENLAWLRNYSIKEADQELAEMCKTTEKTIRFSELFENLKKPEIYKSCSALIPLGIITSLISVISFYANVVLPTSELLSSEQFAVVFSLLTMFITCVCSQLIDRYGRRTLVIPGFTLLTISFACIAVLFFLQDRRILQIPQFPWLIFILITVTYLWGQLNTFVPLGIVRSELFPANFKSIGISLNIICNGCTNFMSTFLFLLIIDNYGIYLNFFILCISSLIGLIIAYLLLPETKGKTLSEIQIALRQ